jgi:hypothetical protein
MDTGWRDQHIAAVSRAFFEGQHDIEAAPQGRLERRGLLFARSRPGPKQNRSFRKDERGVLHEDGIGGSVSTVKPAASSAST